MYFKDKIRSKADGIFITANAYATCFVQEPSEDVVTELLKHGYVEVTGTPRAKELLKTYQDRNKHGLAGRRVFVANT